MPNPLEAMAGPPPAPQPDAQQMMPGEGNALAAPQAQPQPGQAPQQQMPAPSRAQTLSALRHFRAIEGELTPLLKDPELGKSTLKSKIIDGVTKLVSQRMMTPAQAVMQLATVPDKPLDQRKWVQDHYDQTMQARDYVLDHYRASPQQDSDGNGIPDAEEHVGHMSSLLDHYKGLQNA